MAKALCARRNTRALTVRPSARVPTAARTLIAFSSEFLKGAWRRPEELPGIGRYAADAHRIFCEGKWAEAAPEDHALRWYCDWMRSLHDVVA